MSAFPGTYRVYDIDNFFLTSDLHFSHRRIESFCTDRANRLGLKSLRPLQTYDLERRLQEMNEAIIAKWNEAVPNKGATVFVLGDVSFAPPGVSASLIKRLHGSKHLIVGNHDRAHIKQNFESAHQLRAIRFDDPRDGQSQKAVLCHFPIEEWHGLFSGALHFHGHLHGGVSHPLRPMRNRMDVGVDALPEARPYSLRELLLLMDAHNEELV